MFSRQMTLYYDTSDRDNDTDSVSSDEEDVNINPPSLKREKTIRGPLILAKDSDLYVLSLGNGTHLIKSWITNDVVSNRIYNIKTKTINILDPTILEEDRRLLLPHCILQEEYNNNFKENK